MSLLTHWEPFVSLRGEMARLQQQIDRIADRWGMPLPSWPGVIVACPAVNLWEDDDFVYAEAELPGLKLEDLETTVTGDNELTLKGNRVRLDLKHVEWHRQERGFGKFERAITLPARVDPAKVEARLEHGLLTIKMAKSPESKPKRIPVKAE